MDAYFAAIFVPTIVYMVLIAGTLSPLFIPILLQADESGDRDKLSETFSVVTSFVLLFLIAIVSCAMITAHQWIALLFPGFSAPTIAVSVRLIYIIFPSVLFVALAGLLTAVLNGFHKFALAAFAPALSSMAVIAAVFLAHGEKAIYLVGIATAGGFSIAVLVASSGHGIPGHSLPAPAPLRPPCDCPACARRRAVASVFGGGQRLFVSGAQSGFAACDRSSVNVDLRHAPVCGARKFPSGALGHCFLSAVRSRSGVRKARRLARPSLPHVPAGGVSVSSGDGLDHFQCSPDYPPSVRTRPISAGRLSHNLASPDVLRHRNSSQRNVGNFAALFLCRSGYGHTSGGGDHQPGVLRRGCYSADPPFRIAGLAGSRGLSFFLVTGILLFVLWRKKHLLTVDSKFLQFFLRTALACAAMTAANWISFRLLQSWFDSGKTPLRLGIICALVAISGSVFLGMARLLRLEEATHILETVRQLLPGAANSISEDHGSVPAMPGESL